MTQHEDYDHARIEKASRQKTATSEKKEPVTPQSLPDRRVMEGFLANCNSRGRAK